MHPFHGGDVLSPQPFGLRHILREIDLLGFECPFWVFTVVGAAIETSRQVHLMSIEEPTKSPCAALDRLLPRCQPWPASFAAAFRIVAYT
jgi:hypothetical protein